MTAVRSFLVAWIGIAWNSLGLFFTWFLGMFRASDVPADWFVAPAAAPDTRGGSPIPSPAPVVNVPPCEVCGAPSLPLRSHDGHWRCLPHKGVTCDVCDRAIVMPPSAALPDQAWTCATHG